MRRERKVLTHEGGPRDPPPPVEDGPTVHPHFGATVGRGGGSASFRHHTPTALQFEGVAMKAKLQSHHALTNTQLKLTTGFEKE